MKRAALLLVMMVAGVSPVWGIYNESGQSAKRDLGVVPDAVIVQLKSDVEPRRARGAGGVPVTGLAQLDAVSASVSARDFEPVFRGANRPAAGSILRDLTRFYRLEFDAVRDPGLVAAEIAKDPNVVSAEVIPYAAADQFIPNDVKFDSLWYHLDATDNDMDTPEAWETQAGDPDVLIAIFDSGVLFSHQDLRDQIWVNPGEDLDGDGILYDADDFNGVDDDGNGYIDDVIGWDFVASGSGCWPGEDCSVADNNPTDFHGHGTHVAGIAGAATNNIKDVSGVAGGRYPDERGAMILPMRVAWAYNDGGTRRATLRYDYLAEALDYAVMVGARVGNYSYGGSSVGSSVVDAALINAFANGFIFTKSAGNDNVTLPDAYDDFPGVLAVAATNSNDQKAGFSNWGVWVDVSAPGVSILNTYSNEGLPMLAWLQGTSMAAPMVAGIAGLILSNSPYLTKAEVDSIIINTTDNIDAQNPSWIGLLGSGRVNAANALAGLPVADFTADVRQGFKPLAVQFTDLSPSAPTGWAWDFGNGDSSTSQNPLYTYTASGLYDVRFDAVTPTGTARRHRENYVVVHADSTWAINGKNCPGRKATVEIHLTNELPIYSLHLPLTYDNDADLTLLSFSFDSTRVSYFELLDDPFSSGPNKFKVFVLQADVGGGSPPLPPGSGPILRLEMSIGAGAPEGALAAVDTFTVLNYSYVATTHHGVEYVPGYAALGVDVLTYCRGDFTLDGAVNSSDIIALVGFVFKGGSASADPWTMDVNSDGVVTSADIIFLVNYVFKGGTPPE